MPNQFMVTVPTHMFIGVMNTGKLAVGFLDLLPLQELSLMSFPPA